MPFLGSAGMLNRTFLTRVVSACLALVADAAQAQFLPAPVPGLPAVASGSVAWGDYDSDGRLDLLIVGTISGSNVPQLWRNTAVTTNSPPAAPTGLSSPLLDTGVVLKWNAPIDDHTAPAGLSYNVRVGAAPGASDVVSASALGSGVLLLPRMGAAQSRMAILDHLSPGQTYYWSVQAVDTGFAGSSFAAEQRFSTAPLLVNPVQLADGVFQFVFTNRTTLNFDILASSDAALPLTNWTNLGPVTSLGGSLYRFIDAAATGQPLRCYVLREQ